MMIVAVYGLSYYWSMIESSNKLLKEGELKAAASINPKLDKLSDAVKLAILDEQLKKLTPAEISQLEAVSNLEDEKDEENEDSKKEIIAEGQDLLNKSKQKAEEAERRAEKAEIQLAAIKQMQLGIGQGYPVTPPVQR